MLILVIAGALVVLILWSGWGKPLLTRGQWRTGAGLLSLGAFTGAAFVSLRGNWTGGLALAAVGSVLMFGARSQRGLARRPASKAAAHNELSAEDARSLLGVKAEASAEEVRAAYARLIGVLHPDRGGTSGLAAQLNAARDRLLKG